MTFDQDLDIPLYHKKHFFKVYYPNKMLDHKLNLSILYCQTFKFVNFAIYDDVRKLRWVFYTYEKSRKLKLHVHTRINLVEIGNVKGYKRPRA